MACETDSGWGEEEGAFKGVRNAAVSKAWTSNWKAGDLQAGAFFDGTALFDMGSL